MTFEKLLGMSSKEWTEIDDTTLYKLLEPFFIVTRPERISKGSSSTTGSKEKTNKNMSNFAALQKELMKQATLAGIVLPTGK